MPIDPLHLILYWTALALLALGALLCWTFVWRYHKLDWHLYEEGRHIMWFTVTLGAILTATLVFNLLPLPMLVRLCTSIVLFAALDLAILQRHRLLRNREE